WGRAAHGAALLALALLAAQGGAAPLKPGATPALTKIYPRGSHWAVGHLMGKKSTGDFPYGFEEENKTPFLAIPDNMKQLEEYLQWEEISKYLLRLLERNENKSVHFLKGGIPWTSHSLPPSPFRMFCLGLGKRSTRAAEFPLVPALSLSSLRFPRLW
uniref:Gastrin-releasing peptide n=1 Tax=Malurus cyaneus samueli TaxID=2593467 RepID=A0A8C5TGD7_9PASS